MNEATNHLRRHDNSAVNTCASKRLGFLETRIYAKSLQELLEEKRWAAVIRISKKSNTSRRRKIQSDVSSDGKTLEGILRKSLRPQRASGSILDFSEALKAGLDHACGGVCALLHCHVIVKEGLESCNEATDAELDELDEAPASRPKSRLAARPFPTAPLTSSRNSWMEQKLRQGTDH